jgi:hypothetical protein
VDVLGVDPELVVARVEVKGSEPLSTVEMVKELVGERERSTIFDSLSIQRPVVDAHPQGAIGLAGKKDRCTIL